MQAYRKRAKRGFSLVELLAVVLVLAVLAAVAIPLYISQRKSAAARSCKANIAAIAAAESAWALREGAYTTTIADLVGAQEGLAKTPTCPLDGDAYTLATDADGNLTISCGNAADHAASLGAAADYSMTLTKPAKDSLP